MITNDAGDVAIKHFTSNPAVIKIGDTVYHFVPKTNVSLAWISPGDVPAVLGIKAKVCCGNTKNKFLEANELDICLWETGDRCR